MICAMEKYQIDIINLRDIAFIVKPLKNMKFSAPPGNKIHRTRNNH